MAACASFRGQVEGLGFRQPIVYTGVNRDACVRWGTQEYVRVQGDMLEYIEICGDIQYRETEIYRNVFGCIGTQYIGLCNMQDV